MPLRPLAAVFFFALIAPSSTAHADEPCEPPHDEMVVADLGQHVVGIGYQRPISPYPQIDIELGYAFLPRRVT